MPYCDNVHCMSLDQESCQRGKDRMCEDLTGLGFTLHEDAEASSFFPTLGGIIDGKNGKVKPTPSRAWNVISCFREPFGGTSGLGSVATSFRTRYDYLYNQSIWHVHFS